MVRQERKCRRELLGVVETGGTVAVLKPQYPSQVASNRVTFLALARHPELL